MEKFNTVSSVAAPLPLINIDTDMIIPKQFLKTIKRSGLGKNLFDEMRYNQSGDEIDDFVLNQEKYKNTNILVAGDNFGCGSSREHAPWALLDFGIRCVISTSFADIFYNNSIKNGLFPLVLKKDEVLSLDEIANKKQLITVNLKEKKVHSGNNSYFFEVEDSVRERLLHGYDDIELTLKHIKSIKNYENNEFKNKPWKLLKNEN